MEDKDLQYCIDEVQDLIEHLENKVLQTPTGTERNYLTNTKVFLRCAKNELALLKIHKDINKNQKGLNINEK